MENFKQKSRNRQNRKDFKIGKETYDIVKDYSEYSTIQGIVYIFQTNQTTFGKIFWISVVTFMVLLGGYWSVEAYNTWQDNPVITTIGTTAFPVKDLEFPAVTI
jgi:amiloride-sensitive sodium channel